MLKQDFLNELRQGLSGLPQNDIEERIGFYSEMIDDRMEEGLSEEDAVNAIGPVGDIVSQIVADTPLTRIVKENIRPKRKMRVWEIILLVLGFPLWFPLLITGLVILLSGYIVLWAMLICLWAIFASFCACVPASLVGSAVYCINGHVPTGIAALGAALVLAGLSIFLFFGCKAASKGIVKLAKKIVLGIKSIFIRKESAK